MKQITLAWTHVLNVLSNFNMFEEVPGQLPPRKIAPRMIVSRTIAPWMIATRMIAPRTITHEDNGPRGKFLPGQLPPRIIATEEYCSLDNCPLDDYPRIIASGQFLQI